MVCGIEAKKDWREESGRFILKQKRSKPGSDIVHGRFLRINRAAVRQ